MSGRQTATVLTILIAALLCPSAQAFYNPNLCVKDANCYVGKATGMPAEYKGECQDKKGCGLPCCGQRKLR